MKSKEKRAFWIGGLQLSVFLYFASLFSLSDDIAFLNLPVWRVGVFSAMAIFIISSAFGIAAGVSRFRAMAKEKQQDASSDSSTAT